MIGAWNNWDKGTEKIGIVLQNRLGYGHRTDWDMHTERDRGIEQKGIRAQLRVEFIPPCLIRLSEYYILKIFSV